MQIGIPAPKGGWVQNISLDEPIRYAAEVLDNFFPTAQGARLRGGRSLHATIADPVVQIMPYHGGTSKLFAASATDIYDVTTPADATVSPSASVSSLTSGDWSSVNFGNSAGQYLIIANGADSVRSFDGSSWATPSITGVTSSDLTQVWEFGGRLWFIEKTALSAWYLPVNAIAGAATEFPLASLFDRGGALLFGVSWSLDSGEGLDDVIAFVSDQGQIVIYEGSDPASDFVRVGTYTIAKPLTKHAFFKAGGDVAIATEDGIVSLAEAVQKDRAAISRSAITYPIEDAWRQAVVLRDASHTFNCSLWHSRQMLIVSVPDGYQNEAQAFVCNVRTGAWCRYTNWDVDCSAIFEDQLYIGGTSSEIFKGEQTGQDKDSPYTAYWLPSFMPMDGLTALLHARIQYRGNLELKPEMTGAVNYNVELPTVPATAADEDANAWGTGTWGTSMWGQNTAKTAQSEWQSVAGVGNEVSVWCASTSARTSVPEIDLIGMDVLVEQGRRL